MKMMMMMQTACNWQTYLRFLVFALCNVSIVCICVCARICALFFVYSSSSATQML